MDFKQLKNIRKFRKMSLTDVAEKIKKDRNGLAKMESGGRPGMALQTFLDYCDAIGVELIIKLK